MRSQIGFEVTIEKSFDEALSLVTSALQREGFGILTRIDVQATLKEKLNESFKPYLILGACNPPLAHRALSSEPEIGLMLPCNVTVEETDARHTTIRLANPQMMLAMGFEDHPVLAEVAQTAEEKIKNVVRELEQSAVPANSH
jgi:uncharacterized protein (DUF302 family)